MYVDKTKLYLNTVTTIERRFRDTATVKMGYRS